MQGVPMLPWLQRYSTTVLCSTVLYIDSFMCSWSASHPQVASYVAMSAQVLYRSCVYVYPTMS